MNPAERDASLRHSMKDGFAWAVMNGAGERYIHPFAIMEGSGFVGLAAISQLPAFAGAMVQCLSANFVDVVGRRKRLFVSAAAVQAVMWIPACAGVFLPSNQAVGLMTAAYILILSLQNLAAPPWSSVMGDLVPAERRGRYFGLRNLVVGVGICGSFLLGGWLLKVSQESPEPALLGLTGHARAYFLLFAAAAVARLISAWHLARMHEPEYVRQASDRFSLLEFLRRAPKGNFGRFVFYVGLLHLGVGIAGPFFSWYALKALGFDPAEFSISWTLHLIAFFGSQHLWGHLADRIGNKPLIALGGVGISLIPYLWIASGDFVWLLFVQVYDGVVWGAFTIAASNYLYDCVTSPKRARCGAYQSLIVAGCGLVGSAIGASLGLSLAESGTFLGVAYDHPFKPMMAVSGVFRFLPALLLLGSFREVRVGGKAALEEFAGAGNSLPLLKRWWR